jgi:hypothetical protein
LFLEPLFGSDEEGWPAGRPSECYARVTIARKQSIRANFLIVPSGRIALRSQFLDLVLQKAELLNVGGPAFLMPLPKLAYRLPFGGHITGRVHDCGEFSLEGEVHIGEGRQEGLEQWLEVGWIGTRKRRFTREGAILEGHQKFLELMRWF